MTEDEKSELSTKCVQLKMKANDGKMRETDALDTKGILRLIESIPNSKAEPFKLDPEDLKHAYMLVGSVVLHRLESRKFGETMKQVIYSPGQYLVVWYTDILENVVTPPEVYEWAEELLQDGPEGPEGLIYEMWFKLEDEAESYWNFKGIYFYVEENVTRRVEGGKVN